MADGLTVSTLGTVVDNEVDLKATSCVAEDKGVDAIGFGGPGSGDSKEHLGVCVGLGVFGVGESAW